MESIQLPHLPRQPLQLGLFTDVQNAAFLRQQLLQGNADFEYAFVDASVLVSRDHVLAACFRAINDLLNGRLKTRNVHSEIVFSFSSNNNIAESFRRFGISDSTTHLLAIKVSSPLDVVERHWRQNIQGSLVAFTDERLASIRDEARVRKCYRLDPLKKGESGLPVSEAEAFVLGSIALKGS